MKKALILLLLAGMIAPVFAGDAAVLPQGVGRLYIVPAFSFWSDAFDDDSERDDSVLGDATSFNLASALEYGVTPFLSAGLQYIPGYVISNDFSDEENVDATGTGNLDIGAKIQVVGPQGLVPNEVIRLSFLPGVFLPLSSYDAESEAESQAAGDDFAADGVGNSSFGGGMQTAFDYFITPEFYVNVFNEFRLYAAEDFEEAGVEPYALWAGYADGIATASGGTVELEQPGDVNPGYDLTFEIEPTYQKQLSETLRLTGSVAGTWTYSPGQSFVDDYAVDLSSTGNNTLIATGEEAEQVINDALSPESQTLSIGPSAALLVSSLPLPMEFQLDATIPVWGKNSEARNTLAFQWEIYFAF